ncbi:hypothetical protein [uncultured Microscilla sp.]|uniref:hypothetical protein n=1 Tax=uncultured Microscilla sp. TaxID=432653 RepID=UPI0026027606|nr:hypothetical protein [uncultured Microscilla sp.]
MSKIRELLIDIEFATRLDHIVAEMKKWNKGGKAQPAVLKPASVDKREQAIKANRNFLFFLEDMDHQELLKVMRVFEYYSREENGSYFIFYENRGEKFAKLSENIDGFKGFLDEYEQSIDDRISEVEEEAQKQDDAEAVRKNRDTDTSLKELYLEDYKKMKSFNVWTRWIAIGISVIALIVSIVALSKK